jgi:hypothetical protein
MRIDLQDRRTRIVVSLGAMFIVGMAIALYESRNVIVVIFGGFAGILAYFITQLMKRPCPSCGRLLFPYGEGPTTCPSCRWSGYP